MTKNSLRQEDFYSFGLWGEHRSEILYDISGMFYRVCRSDESILSYTDSFRRDMNFWQWSLKKLKWSWTWR